MASEKIVVQSHISRDFLQSAALFKNEKLVIWEYVANALQYVDPGVTPTVVVTIDSKARKIEIADNGRGMDRSGLQNFFVMHGENLDRKAGRFGRGFFGTGKCAAFGIADRLTITSVRNGYRNIVDLRRADVERAGKETIPVRSVEKDVSTKESNRTLIQINEVKLRNFDHGGVVRFVEKHLARWPGKPTVIINNHQCEFAEPPVATVTPVYPNVTERERIGDVVLTLKVAKIPLEQEFQGVVIFSNGVWLETTLAGAEGQPMSHYIFGEIDVPKLDDDKSSIPAFDMSRSMQLNRSNELVQVVLAFIGREVDRLRRQLVAQEQSRRAQEEAKKLESEASRIAEIINQDFHEFSDRIARVRARAGTGRDIGTEASSGGADDGLLAGGNVPGTAIGEGDGSRSGDDSDHERGATPLPTTILAADPTSSTSGKPSKGGGSKGRPRGGFRVEFKELGATEPRARYNGPERTIYVNLEHPQIRAAKGTKGTEEPLFKRLTYEVAFSEYAIALAYEFATNNEYIEPSDAIFEIRDTLDRMSRRAAELYAQPV